MKTLNLILIIYGFLFPIFLIFDFEYENTIYIGIIVIFIFFLLLKRKSDFEKYKRLDVKYYLTSTGGFFGVKRSISLIIIAAFYFTLLYVIFRKELHHDENATTIGLLFNFGAMFFILSGLKTGSIKIAEKGLIDSFDTKLIPYSNLKIDSYDKLKSRLKLKDKFSNKYFSILVDKSSEIKFDDLMSFLKNKLQ